MLTKSSPSCTLPSMTDSVEQLTGVGEYSIHGSGIPLPQVSALDKNDQWVEDRLQEERDDAPEYPPSPGYDYDASPPAESKQLDPNTWIGPSQMPVTPVIVDGMVVFNCPEPDCDRSFSTLAGVTMHRNRLHVSDEVKEKRKNAQAEAQRRGSEARRTAQAAEAALQEWRAVPDAELVDAKVQELMDSWKIAGTPGYDARRKRLQTARKHGMSMELFEEREVARAMQAVTNPTEPFRQPYDDSKLGRPPKVVDPEKEAMKDADRVFGLVIAATNLLFPKGVPGERVMEVAELQNHMIAVLK